jgi:hypothetical protein
MYKQLTCVALLCMASGCAVDDPQGANTRAFLAIEAEIAELPIESEPAEASWVREWSGEYVGGEGWEWNKVALSPQGRIVFSYGGCMWTGGCEGHVAHEIDGGLQLVFDASQEWESDQVHFVRWGERHYLVPESMMALMVSLYNETGPEPGALRRRSIIPVRREDYFATTSGRPTIPEPWRSLLR